MTPAPEKRRGLRLIVESKLNVLLALVPVAWVLGFVAPASPWLFVAAAVSILPLAGLIREATDALAAHSGPTLGGFLNATFGNAAELIIGVVGLRAGHVELVKASISGSIIGNLLVVFGLSMFVGGLGRTCQQFDRRSASNATAMLFLATVALVMPAAFDLIVSGDVRAQTPAIRHLSLWTSVLLIVAYAGGLIYTFTVRHDPFRSHEQAPVPPVTVTQAVGVLAASTILTTIQAELLVGGLQPLLARFGLTELFIGVIIVSLVGNAAEHYSAVDAARRNQMSLAAHIAIGSSAQIALLVAPALVLGSFVLGAPMTLLFHPLEIVGIGLSVLATAIVALDGESNWVEGLQLVALYLVLAVAFYLVPATLQ